MSHENQRTCEQCKQIYRQPMYMVTPDPRCNDHERIIIAAQIKCTCSDDMEIEGEVNAADLSNFKPIIRELIYKKLKSDKNGIPVIDPVRINNCDCVMFVTGFSKETFKNWMALDLLTVEQFRKHIENKNITVEEIRI